MGLWDVPLPDLRTVSYYVDSEYFHGKCDRIIFLLNDGNKSKFYSGKTTARLGSCNACSNAVKDLVSFRLKS
jgi:hypothetical protein